MREPIGRRVRKKLSSRVSKARNEPGERIKSAAPTFGDRNVGSGVFIGATGAAVATVLEDTLGIPFGATVDITDVEESGDEIVYTVDVNAPTENIAEARAFIDSTTGFVSYLTDEYEIEDAEIMTTRMVRDTYRVKVKVERVY